MATIYRGWIEKRLALTGGETPIEIAGEWIPSPDEVVVSASFRLIEPAILTNLRATLLLYENDVSEYIAPGSPDVWQHVTRAIRDYEIVLTDTGDEVVLTATIPRGRYWDLENLHAIAYLQQTAEPKPILQGASLAKRPDFDFDPPLVRSVPEGTGTALFRSELTNRREETDLLRLSLGGTFGNWPTDFLIDGDATGHTEPVQLTLAPGETRTIQVRVQTDEIVEARSGSFFIHSMLSDRIQKSRLRLFNGSPSILLVDDDAGQDDERVLLESIRDLGQIASNWDVMGGHNDESPGIREMNGFDVVIWQTGWSSWLLISWDDQLALADYLDQGGRLFFASQEYLDWLWWTPNFFTQDYLGIETWETDPGYDRLLGVAGDPIGDGLDLPLHFPDPGYMEGDDLVPSGSAQPFLVGAAGEVAATRHEIEGTGARVVFLASAFNAVAEDDPDPNNARTVLSRILGWLTEGQPTGVTPGGPESITTRIQSIRPNPVTTETTVEFTISRSEAADPVSLTIYDVGGRRIADLINGRYTAGRHQAAWNGRASGGRSVEVGVYFLRLVTRDGTQTRKVVLLP